MCVSSAGQETCVWLQPAVHARVSGLQPPHVINHVKWQKAQNCQDCEGDLMELKMGCFVMMQSISFHLGPTRSFAFTKAPDNRFFFCASNTKSRQPVFQAKVQSATRAVKCSGPSLLLLLRRATELGWLCQSSTRVHLSSTPRTLGLDVCSSTVDCRLGVKIVFIFHLRLIHPIQRARSSKMNVHRELDLWLAVCFPPNLGGCSASCLQILPLLLRVLHEI